MASHSFVVSVVPVNRCAADTRCRMSTYQGQMGTGRLGLYFPGGIKLVVAKRDLDEARKIVENFIKDSTT